MWFGWALNSAKNLLKECELYEVDGRCDWYGAGETTLKLAEEPGGAFSVADE